MKTTHWVLLFLIIMLHSTSVAQFQGPKTGFFQGFTDIGTPGIPGTVNYSEPLQEYQLSGSGNNMWFGEDSFSYLWKKMGGDFIVQAQVQFLGEGTDRHRKTGLMIRDGLSPDAAHVSCVIHRDGLTAFQYRSKAGEDMEDGPERKQSNTAYV
ncbi:MAG: hypothetical protein KAR19_07110 [Bacteroidales bacterium]|nr:hypothetical protein [Bacteroidales bacterium]